MLLTDKYADKIYGTTTCYDRMIIQGYTPGWSHAEGMAGYLKANKIRIFDFANFSQSLTEQVRSNAQHIADENGIEIEFIRKLHAFRKDDRIRIMPFSKSLILRRPRSFLIGSIPKTCIKSWISLQSATALWRKPLALVIHEQSNRSSAQ